MVIHKQSARACLLRRRGRCNELKFNIDYKPGP